MKNKKLWIFIGMIVLILILNHIFGWSSYLGNTENLKFLENMVQENLVLAIGIYTILTIISCVVLALPGVTFAIVAGLVFGPVLGTICCSVATTLGAMVAFVAGRFFLQDIIKPMAMKNKYLKKWLFESFLIYSSINGAKGDGEFWHKFMLVSETLPFDTLYHKTLYFTIDK